MKSIDPRNVLIFVLCGLFAWLLVERSAQATPAAQDGGGGGDATRDLIAVTGGYANGVSNLYMIDPKTRHMTVYRMVNGRALEFVGARDCSYDFLLETYNDESPAPYLPSSLRRSWDRYGSKGLTPKAGSGRPRMSGPEALPTATGSAALPGGAGTTPEGAGAAPRTIGPGEKPLKPGPRFREIK